MIVFSHPTGNQNARHAALSLARAGLLEEFWTSINWDESGLLDRCLPARVRSELQRRSFPAEVRPFIRTLPWREMGRLISARLRLGSLFEGESALFSVNAVYRAMDRHMARRVLPRLKPAAVYAYEDGAAETFRAGQRLGSHRFYELPIGYWRAAQAIFREESEREPEWASTLRGISDSPAKLARKDEELQLASTIIVPSNFTKETLSLAPGITAPIYVIPYGAPAVIRNSKPEPNSGNLRVLFVGALGQRKGLSYLLQAVGLLKNSIELTLIGRKQSETCGPLNDATRRHRWLPSLPHSEVLKEMSRHDVLVFPSLFEGFGLVILEAMSQGMPVITTPNGGGLDLITHGQDGFGVPIRSAEAIAEKLELLAGDRALLARMSTAAIETARRCSWENYGRRLVEVVTQRVRNPEATEPQTAGEVFPRTQ